MALDREALRKPVRDAREALTGDLVEVLEGVYGIHKNGTFEEASRLPALADPRARETRELLELVLPPRPAGKAERERFEEAFDATVRSLAFTHLNRLVAFKMMEHPSRKILAREAVGKGLKSRGFIFYLADHPEDEALYSGADQEGAYRNYLLWLAGQFHREIGVLFDPDDLASRVFPQPKALQTALEIINAEALAGAWEHEEALGWVYQFYTPKELRDKARKASQAPRNSYELAFRNQFYTPDYVVRFLTDNTLGRLWLEMKPETALRERCAYLVVRPDEALAPRAKKDPREIRVLDPACGSGHFLLYAFELFEVIYREAYDDPDLGPALSRDFPERAGFEARIPALIIEHNLHGIDIDKRATQIASLVLFLKAKTRNKDVRIERGNIVCAEPMPGDRRLFEDFKKRKLGNAAGVRARILDGLWKHLELAGEAGSLLRAESEIERLVAEEHKKWSEYQRKGLGQTVMFTELRKPEQQEMNFRDVTDAQFWTNMEGEIEKLLREYAGEAAGAQAAHRKMFAKDGSEGFRFIDATRRRYDIVLMNPPFGAPTPRSKSYIEKVYSSGRADIFACFVDRCTLLIDNGILGVLSTEAGFFRKSLTRWREEVLLARCTLETMVHMGDNVLDSAKVRVAAYALRVPRIPMRTSRFVRVLGKVGREDRIRSEIRAAREGCSTDCTYEVGQEEFAKLPYAVYGYWASHGVRNLFQKFPCASEVGISAKSGAKTLDDARFIRLAWEIGRGGAIRWRRFAKGGDYSPYYDDIHLMLYWGEDALSLKQYLVDYRKERGWSPNWTAELHSVTYYFRRGLTWPRRTTKRFAPKILPEGCIFADKGPAMFVPGDADVPLWGLLGIVNSRAAGLLLSLGTGMAESADASNSYEVGLVQKLPIPRAALRDEYLADAVRKVLNWRREADSEWETASAFVLPFPAQPSGTLVELVAHVLAVGLNRREEYARNQSLIESMAVRHYGLNASESVEVEKHVGGVQQLLPSQERKVGPRVLGERILSWSVGCAFGRFDVRLATGERPIPELPEPFAPLPSYSPGMLPDGKVPDGYPLRADEDGILVDDESHEDDVVTRVREVLRLIWRDRAEAIEKEACAILKVKSLRDYFARTGNGGFWTDHVKRYSKSRRKAPIYWLLQSSRGSYGIWVYLHKLDKDTLSKIVGPRYLEGKIRRVRAEIAELRPGGEKKKGITKKEEKRLEELDDLEAELLSFDIRIRAIAGTKNERGEVVGYAPDLDDGVVLNAAPLHELIPWPTKKKLQGRPMSELEVYWRELAEGKYDWSHIAMRYWPDRVTEKCRTDKSLAIAHGLDQELFPGLREELARRVEEPDAEDGSGDEDEEDDVEDDGDEEG